MTTETTAHTAPDLQLFDDTNTVEDLLSLATRHGDESGNDYEIGDLQELLRAAWEVMTPAQRSQMLRSPQVSNVAEGCLVDSLVTCLDDIDEGEYEEACEHFGLDSSFQYSENNRMDIVNHMRLEKSFERMEMDAEPKLLPCAPGTIAGTSKLKVRPRP